MISKRLSDRLGAFTPLKEPYELGIAAEKEKLKIIDYSRKGILFQGDEVLGGTTFEVAENLRKDVDLIIGRPEVDAWDVIFTPEGAKPKKVPIEFEIL